MAGSVDRRALDYAVELEEADERLAALIRALVELEREAAELTLQAAAGEELAARYPAERERLERSAAELGELARGRRAELAQAEGQLASAEGQRRPNVEAVAAARRLVVRTRDLLQIALDRLGQAENAAQELEAEAARRAAEAPLLGQRASALAGRLRAAPRVSSRATDGPEPGSAGVQEWGSRAAAALLVARSGLESERERVVRQANEHGGSVLGEPLFSASVTGVRERLERVASSSPT